MRRGDKHPNTRFYRVTLCSRGICCRRVSGLSVRPSVRLNRYCTKKAKRKIT